MRKPRPDKQALQDVVWRELDRKMVEYLLFYGPLTIPQMRFLLRKDGMDRENKSLYNRLSYLRQHGLVESFMFYRESGGRLSAVYSLPYGKKTLLKSCLERVLGEPLTPEIWKRTTRLSRAIKVGTGAPRIQTAYHHEITVKNVLLSIAGSEAGVLESWEDDLRVKFTFTAKNKRRTSIVKPDLFFSWRTHAFPEQSFYYFVEVQFSRKPGYYIQDRFEKYMRLLLSGQAQKKLGLTYFPTLLFLLSKKNGTAELNRYAYFLRKVLTAEEPNLKKWEEVFRCGVSFVEHFSQIEHIVDPAGALWYDLAALEKGEPQTLASLTPNSVRSKLVELRLKGGYGK